MYPAGLNIVQPVGRDVDGILNQQPYLNAINRPLQQRYSPIPALYPNDFYLMFPPEQTSQVLRSAFQSSNSAAAALGERFVVNAGQSFAQNQQMANGPEMVSYTSADLYPPAAYTTVDSEVNLPGDGCYQGLLRHSRSAAVDDCSIQTTGRILLASPPAMNNIPPDWVDFQRQQQQHFNRETDFMLESGTTGVTMYQQNMAFLHANLSDQNAGLQMGAYQTPVDHQNLTSFPSFTGRSTVHNDTIRLRPFTRPIWYPIDGHQLQQQQLLQQQLNEVEENYSRQTQIRVWSRNPTSRYLWSGFAPPYSWLEPSAISGAEPNASSQHSQRLIDSGQPGSECVNISPMEGVRHQLTSLDCYNDSERVLTTAVDSFRQPTLHSAQTGDQRRSKTNGWCQQQHATPQINSSSADVLSIIPTVASLSAQAIRQSSSSCVTRPEIETTAADMPSNNNNNVNVSDVVRAQRFIPAELFGYHYWLTCETFDHLQCCLQLIETSRQTSFSQEPGTNNVTGTASKLLQKLYNDYVQLLRSAETRFDLLEHKQWHDLLRDSSFDIKNIRQSLTSFFTSISERYCQEDKTQLDSAIHGDMHTLNLHLYDFYICLDKFLQVGSSPSTCLPCENAQSPAGGLGSVFATRAEASDSLNTCVDAAVAMTAANSNETSVGHSDRKYISGSMKLEDCSLYVPVENHAQLRVNAKKLVSSEASERDCWRPLADEKETNSPNATATKDFREDPFGSTRMTFSTSRSRASNASNISAKRSAVSCTQLPVDDSQKYATRMSESNIQSKNEKNYGLTGQPVDFDENNCNETRAVEQSNKPAVDATTDDVTARSIKQEPINCCSVSSNIFDQLTDYIQTKRKTADCESPSPSCAVNGEMPYDDEYAKITSTGDNERKLTTTTTTFCSTSGDTDVDHTAETASTSERSFFVPSQFNGRKTDSQQSLQFHKPESTSTSVSMDMLINEVLTSGLSPSSTIASPNDSVTSLRPQQNCTLRMRPQSNQFCEEDHASNAAVKDSKTREMPPHSWSPSANVDDSRGSDLWAPVKYCLPAADATDSSAISNYYDCCSLIRSLTSSVSRICANSCSDTKRETRTTEDVANYARATRSRSDICCKKIKRMTNKAKNCQTKGIGETESPHEGSASKSITTKVNTPSLAGDASCNLASTNSMPYNEERTSSLETELADSSSQQTLDPANAQQQQVKGNTSNIDSKGLCRKRIAQLLASSSSVTAVKKQLCSVDSSSSCKPETGKPEMAEPKEIIVSSAAREQQSGEKAAADSLQMKATTTETCRKSSQLQVTAFNGSRQRLDGPKSATCDQVFHLDSIPSTENFSNLSNNSFVQPSSSNSLKEILSSPSSLSQQQHNNSQTKLLKTTNAGKLNCGLNTARSSRPREAATNQRQIKLIDPEPVKKPVRGRPRKAVVANGVRFPSQPLTKTKKTM